ncbi:MAG TPA: hypothetical protein VF142_13515 [Longimicrobium sp.]
MRDIARRWRTVLLALPLAGALGFGATQALASPAAGARTAARECVADWECWKACPYAGGTVTWRGDCLCCPY